jgi:cell wall-associated NlpC family hydrolase
MHPQPGTFFLARIGGLLGLAIAFGQWVIGDASRYSHAGIVLDDGTVLEAMPGGARIAPLADVLARRPLAFSWAIPLTDAQRADVVAGARALEHVPYGFTAYLHLALCRFGIRWGWLISRLQRDHRFICSQLVDFVYAGAGVPLFTDGRACFEVTPGDLANALIERDWQAVG